MSRDHFAQMYKNKSTRHDEPHDSHQFHKDFSTVCGMLYSIVTLKAFFPKSPAPEMNNSLITDGNGRDQEETQLPPIE